MDTIFAVSSGAPPAAIAVLRISGARAFAAVQQLAGNVPAPRHAVLRTLRDAAGEPLDQALVLCFPGPRSATGEDLAELHLHGGRAVVRAVEAALAELPELRAAEAGEFTRRALLHGRLDLSEAEGLGDLLMAETEAQRRAAIRSAGGAVRRHAEDWTNRLLGLAARIEAELDHGDEDDVAGADPLPALRTAAAALGSDIAAVAARPPVERLRDGLCVALGGPPNAGKSTLFNALAERDAAIVSPIAGTTRDRIEIPVVREGIAWLLIDTAGLAEETDDPIEAIGVARARDALAEADLLLWLGDDAPPLHPCALWVHARADVEGRAPAQADQLVVSVREGRGLDTLWRRMADAASELLPPPDLVALNARQRSWCNAAADALARASLLDDPLLFAEELRAARRALDAITGRAGVEDVLDALFGKFCIGK
ncbi:tRNA uridine-5-carboxymethylaminomethyl(34) synthesis GTPase MnmE [Sphingomonas sp. ABOLD]|uniref:tRNA modification GTPase MnmE n=1 Tax=Sphingomonas trueperi TaxID=53317 RepID=A0A7X5XWA3_9SPHN|nr:MULTISPECIES: tRNA uridine-5-carboxymethylaminomethyl(34) synthesis GTPase MnmE [Sphingomonas]NJB96160.1 tRNA modification GTPase [Sphingomonas trueperi]RSV51119.1 tRNA uridine-5-carboxymethylaminomethyl(34) synthesis GTPase MnmE [Sphingomonas sp. ABOLD]